MATRQFLLLVSVGGMDESTREGFKAVEKILDRHEDAIEFQREKLNTLEVHVSQCDARSKTAAINQEEIKKTQRDLELWKAKLTGVIAAGIAAWEVVKAKWGA